MLPPNDPRTDAGPDPDDPEMNTAGWDPYVTSLLTRELPVAAAGDPEHGAPVMSLARIEERRRR